MGCRAFFTFTVVLTTLLAGGCRPEAAAEMAVVIEVATPPPPALITGDPSREQQQTFMLDSYRKVGKLHTVTLCGDFQQLIDIQHWGIMLEMKRREPAAPASRHGCSMFQARGRGGNALLGRNFDQKDTEMLAAWCYPDSGYTSLSFIPLNQWGFTEENPFDPADPRQKRFLLSGPTTAIEGMNEKGVVITLASLGKQTTRSAPDRQPRFLIHLVREILDHAASLSEAVAIAQRYNIFDNGRDVISHHIFLADADSGSAVLEWQDGVMRVLRSGPNPQVVTNRPLCNVDEQQLRADCRRYRTLSDAVNEVGIGLDWQDGMDTLQRAAQHNVNYVIEGEQWIVSTQWSAVFDMTAREAFVCAGRDYETVYRLQVPFRN
jgi:hypothetical protein